MAEHEMSVQRELFLQRIKSQAREEVILHREDYIAIGVSPQQVEAAATNAEKRAESEFERKSKEDPLCRIEEILNEAAETPDERQLAQAGIERLKAFRLCWTKILQEEKIIAEKQGTTFSIKETVRKVARRNPALTPVDRRDYGPKLESKDFLCVTVLCALVTDKAMGTKIEPSDTFRVRVLRGMGVLGPNKDLSTLRLFSFTSGAEYASRVPTGIMGVDVTVGFKSPNILAAMDLSTLKKVVSEDIILDEA